jgi:hypothetical protein
MRYRTLLERRVDEWEDGYGVVQIVNPETTEENELRFCYYKQGEFVNRPLTVEPTSEVADRVAEVVETMASLARTFTPDEIEALVEELGEDRILELAVLIEELGRGRLLEILEAHESNDDD